MIATARVAEVRRLLAEGTHSQRAIARMTGLSRGTVDAIASGKRSDREPRREDDDEDEPLGPPERCPECGGMVYMPCRLCRVRAAMKRLQHPLCDYVRRPAADVSFALRLRPEHQVRYEQVHARKIEEERQQKESESPIPSP